LSRFAVHVRAGIAFILTRKLRQKRKACPAYSWLNGTPADRAGIMRACLETQKLEQLEARMDEIADRVARDRTNAARERTSTHEAQRPSHERLLAKVEADLARSAGRIASANSVEFAHLCHSTMDLCNAQRGNPNNDVLDCDPRTEGST
jgi:hypothetical protein